MKGYTRDPQMTEELLSALRAALYARPNERLGQLLINLTPVDWGSEVGHNAWSLYDEKWVTLLREAAAQRTERTN